MKAVQGICLDKELLEAARNAAKQDGRSLSNYIQNLVRNDLQKDESQTVLDGLAEAYSIDELRGILSQRTADQAVGGTNS
jgi:hypothetical protein